MHEDVPDWPEDEMPEDLSDWPEDEMPDDLPDRPEGEMPEDLAHQADDPNDPDYVSSDNEDQENAPRFRDIDVDQFIEDQQNRSTSNKTKQHMRLLEEFLATRDEQRPVNDIPPREFNEYLAMFFITLKKPSSVPGASAEEYEPSTLKGIQSSVSRFLKGKKYDSNIITDDVFYKSRQAISSKLKQLKKMGLGNKPKRKRAPTQAEISKMWSKGALGDTTPESLQHTIWWILSTRFGLRANQENYDLRWGDVQVNESNGHRFITRNERATKTR